MLIGAMVLTSRILPGLRGARPSGPGALRGEEPAVAPERPPLIAEEDRPRPLIAEEYSEPPVVITRNAAEPEQPRVGFDERRYPGSSDRDRSVPWRWRGGRRLSRWARARQEARELSSEPSYDDSEMEHLVRERLYGPNFRRR